MTTVTIPTVHMNGTSREALLDGYVEAVEATRIAIESARAPQTFDTSTLPLFGDGHKQRDLFGV